MGSHRNSQKRYYVENAIYFITTNTYDHYPYFDNEVLCELFIQTLGLTSQIKEFEIHGYAINPEHIHLLIQPNGRFNYSEFMGTLKRNFARDCNSLLVKNDLSRNIDYKGNDGAPQDFGKKEVIIKYYDKLNQLSELFTQEYSNCTIAKFKWQASFYDHIIRDQDDLLAHLQYIQIQPIKHRLDGRKWYWIKEESTYN